MAAISANAFSLPGMNSRFPSEFFELFKNQQQNLGSLNPLFLNNEFIKAIVRAQIANSHAAAATVAPPTNISTPTLVEAAEAAVAANKKRLISESQRHHDVEEEKPRKRSRIGGQSVKTAEVWKYFTQIPNEQAAKCDVCSKTIKATNSSTTGMIRHLRSCHANQHEELQKARQQNSIRKVWKSGVIDRERLLQQLEAAEKEGDNDRISETIESIAASTSSNASEADIQIKGYTIERLMSTPKHEPKLEHDETFGDTPLSKPAKRGRPPKITLEESMTNECGFVQNQLHNELSVLFSLNVLPVDIMDNYLFRNFLQKLAPGYPIAYAEEFRTKILPSHANTSFNPQTFLKNNNFIKTPTRSAKSSRVNSEGKAASPTPTNESGFHDEEESHATDQSSVSDSLFNDIMTLCASVKTEAKSPSTHGETDSVISDKSSESADQFENMFDELLDHIGPDVFPRENLHILVTRLFHVYITVKSSQTLTSELFNRLNVSSDANLDEVVIARESNDSGLDMNISDKMFPRLWNCIVFAANCFHEINALIEKDLMVSVKRFNDADFELLDALHRIIINPEN